MNKVKFLRERTKLSAQKFGDLYGIPLRTIQDWEREVRTAPEYVINLLERAVNEDFPRVWKDYDKGSVHDPKRASVESEVAIIGEFKNYKEVAAALNKELAPDEPYTEDDVIAEHMAGYLDIYRDGIKLLYL